MTTHKDMQMRKPEGFLGNEHQNHDFVKSNKSIRLHEKSRV